MQKQQYGQFYTTNSGYIIRDLIETIPNDSIIVDPFAGNGDLIKYISKYKDNIKCEMYDIFPNFEGTINKDTLLNPPSYENKWIITNPPYLARNKNKDKTLYDLYDLNDLYKISLKTFIGSEGVVIIIPLNFLSDKDRKIRKEFLSKYEIQKLYIFEETVFEDTTYTVCSFSFIRKDNIIQNIPTTFIPTNENITLTLKGENSYLIGDEFWDIINHDKPYDIKRLRKDIKDVIPNSNIFLRAIDTGSKDGMIKLYLNEHFYGKDTDRTFATIILPNEFKNISIEKQQYICDEFNRIINYYREKYHSLFLTNYRNSTKNYSRKRIGFEDAYKIISYILKKKYI